MRKLAAPLFALFVFLVYGLLQYELSKELDNVDLRNKQIQELITDNIEKQNKIFNDLKQVEVDLSKIIPIEKVVAEWSPQVASVRCLFIDGKSTITTSGSGFLTNMTDRPYSIMTNKHIIVYNKSNPKVCSVIMPNGDEYVVNFSSGQILLSETHDKALIVIDKITQTTKALVKHTNGYYCNNKAEIGDRIVVIGYPSSGSKYGLTATEGIISGYDDDYYVISAKIDKGNSGGIAVSVDRNCIVGMPTLVVEGGAESFGRILSSMVILNNTP